MSHTPPCTHTHPSNRREFLRWLAASPLLAAIPGRPARGQQPAHTRAVVAHRRPHMPQLSPSRSPGTQRQADVSRYGLPRRRLPHPGHDLGLHRAPAGIIDQRIVVKGLMTHEDSALALEHGVDGIWVSNHGGRVGGSGRATIDALPETAAGRVGPGPRHRGRRLSARQRARRHDAIGRHAVPSEHRGVVDRNGMTGSPLRTPKRGAS